MPDTLIIILIGIIIVVLIDILDKTATNIRSITLFPYVEDDFDGLDDLAGFPLFSMRDFSGDDGKVKQTNGNPRFSDAQNKVLQLPAIAKKDKPPVKPGKIIDAKPVEVEEEDVDFEFKAIKALKKPAKKKAVKKDVTKK